MKNMGLKLEDFKHFTERKENKFPKATHHAAESLKGQFIQGVSLVDLSTTLNVLDQPKLGNRDKNVVISKSENSAG